VTGENFGIEIIIGVSDNCRCETVIVYCVHENIFGQSVAQHKGTKFSGWGREGLGKSVIRLFRTFVRADAVKI